MAGLNGDVLLAKPRSTVLATVTTFTPPAQPTALASGFPPSTPPAPQPPGVPPSPPPSPSLPHLPRRPADHDPQQVRLVEQAGAALAGRQQVVQVGEQLLAAGREGGGGDGGGKEGGEGGREMGAEVGEEEEEQGLRGARARGRIAHSGSPPRPCPALSSPCRPAPARPSP